MKYLFIAFGVMGLGSAVFFGLQYYETSTADNVKNSKAGVARSVASSSMAARSKVDIQILKGKFQHLSAEEKKFLYDFSDSEADRAVAEGMLLSRHDTKSSRGAELLKVIAKDRKAGIKSLLKAVQYKSLKGYDVQKSILIETAGELANEPELKAEVAAVAKEEFNAVSNELPAASSDKELNAIDQEFVYVQQLSKEDGEKLVSAESYYNVAVERSPASADDEAMNLYKEQSNPVIKNMVTRGYLLKQGDKLDESTKDEFKEAGFDLNAYESKL
jgi:hypothetical protein